MKNDGKFLDVYGSNIYYLEAGEGNPILFLHGIPTSSYVWRNIIPYLSSLGRCIAPDLIGFGKSDKPDITYSVTDHIKYIGKFIESLNLKNITLVMHGWGSVIGLDYAMKHESNCSGLVFYESFLRPQDEGDLSLPYQEQINYIQNNEDIYNSAINGSIFIDTILSQIIMQGLPEDQMQRYREPFLEKGTGKPILQYLNELPRGDAQGTVEAIIATYSKKLVTSKLPKLLLYSIPGFITTIATASWAKDNLPNLEIVDIGEELHLGQESHPELIGEAISAWLQAVEQTHV